MRQLFFIAFLLTWLLIQTAPPRLFAAPALQMTAQPAFAGRFKNGEWLPVFVNIENSGPDLAGEIRVSITNQAGRLDFAVPAELPVGARKRFTLYILPNNFSRSAKVEFVAMPSPGSDESGQNEKILLTQMVELSVIPNDRYVIGMVMGNPAGLAAMSPPQLTGRRERADLIDLSLAEIPDRHEGLRILNTLILNDVDTSLLTPAQRTALSRWVAEGGRLVLGGGAGAARTLAGLPADLQPVVLANQQEVLALSGLETYTDKPIRIPGPFLLVSAQPVPGATILLDQVGTQAEMQENSPSASQDNLPLIVELPFGAGQVDFVALDLSQSPFDAWAGVTDFAERLLSPGAAWPEFLAMDIAPQQLSDSQMYYPLTSLPALDLPSVRFLGLLLAGYIILVGPVNYLFLRWRDRLAWAWVTIPALTLTFASLAYGLGFSLRGSDIIINQISVMEMGQDGQATRSHTYVGIFSPRRQTYDIEVAAETLLRPLGQGGYDPWSNLPSNSGAMKVIQGQPAHIQGLAVDQWSMQSFVAETTSDEAPGLVSRLTATRDSLRGYVVNQSNVTWQDVIIVFNAQFQKLGDLAPGQETQVHLDFQSSNPVTGFGSYMLYQDEFNRPTGPSREISFKQSVLDSTVFSGNRLNLSDSPLLIAWQENNSPLEIRLAGYQINSQETTFLYSPLTLNFDETQVAVPPGFSHVEILSVKGDASTCTYGAGLNGAYVYQGTAEVKLSLPNTLRQVQPHRLDLYLRTDGNWAALPTVELYDQTDETWVLLEEVKTGSNPIKDVARFYNRDEAALQVRISNDGVNGGCLFLDLALEGERR